jgi:hypothetical protein
LFDIFLSFQIDKIFVKSGITPAWLGLEMRIKWASDEPYSCPSEEWNGLGRGNLWENNVDITLTPLDQAAGAAPG